MTKKTGIAGYSGSGKSTVARLLAGLAPGTRIIDADAEAKNFISDSGPVVDRLKGQFGPLIMDNDRLSFQRLGAIVFSTREKLAEYNAIVHPPLLAHLNTMLESGNRDAIILDAALIPLWGIESWFDRCIWVHAPFEARVARFASRRPDLDPLTIKKRLQIQEAVMKEPGDGRYTRCANNGTIEDLTRSVASLCR